MTTASPDPELAEAEAIRADAEQRLEELRRVRAVLLPDADDPAVLSELVAIQGQIRQAEDALREVQDDERPA